MIPVPPTTAAPPRRTIAILVDTCSDNFQWNKANLNAIASAVERILAHHETCPSCEVFWTYRFFNSSRSCVSLTVRECIPKSIQYEDVQTFRGKLNSWYGKRSDETRGAKLLSSIARSLDDMISDVSWSEETDNSSVDSFLDDDENKRSTIYKTCEGGHALSPCLYLVSAAPHSTDAYKAFGGSQYYMREAESNETDIAPTTNSTTSCDALSRSQRERANASEKGSARELRPVLAKLHKRDIRLVWINDVPHVSDMDQSNTALASTAFRRWISSASPSASVILLSSLLQTRQLFSIRHLFSTVDRQRSLFEVGDQHNGQEPEGTSRWRWDAVEVLVPDSDHLRAPQGAKNMLCRYFSAELGCLDFHDASLSNADAKKKETNSPNIRLVLRGFHRSPVADDHLLQFDSLQGGVHMLRPLVHRKNRSKMPQARANTSMFAGLMLMLAKAKVGIVAEARSENPGNREPYSVFIQPTTSLSATVRMITSNLENIFLSDHDWIADLSTSTSQQPSLCATHSPYDTYKALQLPTDCFGMYLPNLWESNSSRAVQSPNSDHKTIATSLQESASFPADASLAAYLDGLGQGCEQNGPRIQGASLIGIVSETVTSMQGVSGAEENVRRQDSLICRLKPPESVEKTKTSVGKRLRSVFPGSRDIKFSSSYDEHIDAMSSRTQTPQLQGKESPLNPVSTSIVASDSVEALDFEHMESRFSLTGKDSKSDRIVQEQSSIDDPWSNLNSQQLSTLPGRIENYEEIGVVCKKHNEAAEAHLVDHLHSRQVRKALDDHEDLSGSANLSKARRKAPVPQSQDESREQLTHQDQTSRGAGASERQDTVLKPPYVSDGHVGMNSVSGLYFEAAKRLSSLATIGSGKHVQLCLDLLGSVASFIADNCASPAYLQRVLKPHTRRYDQISDALQAVRVRVSDESKREAEPEDTSPTLSGKFWKALLDAFEQALWRIARSANAPNQKTKAAKKRQQKSEQQATAFLSCAQVTAELTISSLQDRILYRQAFSQFFSHVLACLVSKASSPYKETVKTICAEFEQECTFTTPDLDKKSVDAPECKARTVGYATLGDIERDARDPTKNFADSKLSTKLRKTEHFVDRFRATKKRKIPAPPIGGDSIRKMPRTTQKSNCMRELAGAKKVRHTGASSTRSQFMRRVFDVNRAKDSQRPLGFVSKISKAPKVVAHTQKRIGGRAHRLVVPQIATFRAKSSRDPEFRVFERSDEPELPPCLVARIETQTPNTHTFISNLQRLSDVASRFPPLATEASIASQLHMNLDDARNASTEAVSESPCRSPRHTAQTYAVPILATPHPDMPSIIPETPLKRKAVTLRGGKVDDKVITSSPTVDLICLTHIPKSRKPSPKTPRSSIRKTQSPVSEEPGITRSATGQQQNQKASPPHATRGVARNLNLGNAQQF